MKNLPLLVGTLITTLVLIIGVAVVFSGSGNQTTQAEQVAGLTSDASHIRGNPEAQIEIVEFSDFQCPACRATQPLVEALFQQYPDQIKLVYRHYPLLQLHPYSRLAAQLSELAADEGKFWEMHDLLFERQIEWSALGSEEEVLAMFETYTGELEIDKSDFLSRIQSSDIKSRVDSDLALSQQLKLSATPTFFVNGYQTPAQGLTDSVESILTETE